MKTDNNGIVRTDGGREFTDLLTDVVIELRKDDILASVEYPGYIAVGELSFGTVNGNWGWNDNDGNGGDSDISGESEDVAAVVTYITNVVAKHVPE